MHLRSRGDRLSTPSPPAREAPIVRLLEDELNTRRPLWGPLLICNRAYAAAQSRAYRTATASRPRQRRSTGHPGRGQAPKRSTGPHEDPRLGNAEDGQPPGIRWPSGEPRPRDPARFSKPSGSNEADVPGRRPSKLETPGAMQVAGFSLHCPPLRKRTFIRLCVAVGSMAGTGAWQPLHNRCGGFRDVSLVHAPVWKRPWRGLGPGRGSVLSDRCTDGCAG